MSEALAEAQAAMDEGEVPIGCVIVHEGKIVGRGHNRRETDNDPTAHAEIDCPARGREAIGELEIAGLRALYVTLEPCPMCAGAIVQARIPTLVYGCDDPKAGAARTLYRICEDARLNHVVEVATGMRGEESAELLKEFFRRQRALGKK